MFDLKSLVTKAVEDKTLNVNEYIFMPERVDMMVKDGRLSCVLNTNGKVDFIVSIRPTPIAISKHEAGAHQYPYLYG